MMDTMQLDPGTWDLTLDANGNIAKATGGYALAQDAASAIKLFQGELWFDTTQGVAYWGQILGYLPPVNLLKAKLVAAALTVPGVQKAACFISAFTARDVQGQVQVSDASGNTGVASF